MEQEKIARINALAHKAKAEGLTLVGQLENTTIVRPDGTRQKVQKKKK